MDEGKVSIVQAAAAAARDGIAVVPVREDGSKRPDLASWAEYQVRKPTRDELRAWFGQYERIGLGWITGAVSGGLECIDFDDHATFAEFVALAKALGSAPALRVLAGYQERTPHGAHLFLRSPAPEGNIKLARSEAGAATIETRGEGGFVVVAPSYGSVHPTGEPYTTLEPFAEGSIPILTTDERDEVFTLARSLDRGHREAVSEPTGGSQGIQAGTRPGDLYNARASWSQVLEPFGWRLAHRRGDECYWTRPGARTGGVDATTNYAGSGLLYVFSTSAVPFEPERGYGMFSAYATLAHAGDYRAAAIDLAGQGYTDQVEPAPKLTGKRPPAPAPAPTPEPKPTSIRSADYKFAHGWPKDHFVARYIAYAAGRTDAAHEYHEAAALALLAACTPNVRTYLAPWPDGLNTSLYLIMVGGTTSSRKSTSLAFARRLMSQVEPAAVLAERMTPEAMVEQLAARSRQGSLLVGDEFGEALETILKRDSYMSGIRELLLSLYGSRRYKYARRSKRDKGGEVRADVDEIIDPHLVVLTASTGAIFDALSRRDVQTGLLPRFGIIYPQSQPPRRHIYDVAPNGDEDEAWLVDYLRRLYLWAASNAEQEIKARWEQTALIALDEAGERIENDPEEILQRLGPMAIKIAMLSSLGEGVPAVPLCVIEHRDAQQGVKVMERFEAAAILFADEIGGVSADQRRIEQAIDRARKMLREQGGSATRSTISRLLKVTARHLDELEATMTDRGIIRVTQQAAEGPGRPAKVWSL